MRSLVRVVTSTESAAGDASAIAAGIPSRALMQRAGAAAAGEIALRFRDRLSAGVLVVAGPGNNGGDAWVVARALSAAGVRVRIASPIAPKTDDARYERGLLGGAGADGKLVELVESDVVEDHGEAIVVDGLLGTGAAGAPRDAVARGIDAINAMRARGAIIAALDVPSGLNATTGVAAGVAVVADITLTFGAVKRGLLVNRDLCGALVALDIGLPLENANDGSAARLVDEWWVAAHVPAIAAASHKGIRKKLAIIGGAHGMAGASILAARSALRSGVGMVKLIVAADSLPAVQEAEPYALAAPWPRDDDEAARDVAQWADAVVIGPGLGRTDASRELVERVLRCWKGPALLDADALTLWEGKAPEMAALLAGRPAMITPHVAEFARLAGVATQRVIDEHFDIGLEMAAQLNATVLLKGVPTVVTAPNGRRLVSASGTAALATAGSGDVLSGVAGTLLAQLGDPFLAAACGAWVHGRAAERVPAATTRGVVLDDVVNELRGAWSFDTRPARYPVLAELASAAPPR